MNTPHPHRPHHVRRLSFALAFLLLLATAGRLGAQTYPIVDTGQTTCYSNSAIISAPVEGAAFYGQDAQVEGNQPSYTDNGDGTITDHVTGLMWVKARGEKLSWADAVAGADTLTVAGYDDWRLPTIKELYSLIQFTGHVGMTEAESEPYLDTDYFDFAYGDMSAGERIIDCQDWSATEYTGFTMNGDSTVFGVNFADGRIKGYPKYRPESGEPHLLYARFVRGNTDYGINDFVENGDSTITDRATGLMWSVPDSREGMDWEAALAWVQQKNSENYLGHDDWRLPNAKELQSLVDYTRSPSATQSPAIDPRFEVTELEEGEYPFYWSSTTHRDGPLEAQYAQAVYVAFGRALGWMEMPPGSGNYLLLDVHGAGAQRSDPKAGDPADYPHGRGPQGDVIRIDNYVRLVRDAAASSTPEQGNSDSAVPAGVSLQPNYPNPFNPGTTINFTLSEAARVNLRVFNLLGQNIATLVDGPLGAGAHSVEWNAANTAYGSLPSGIYVVHLEAGGQMATQKIVYLK